MGLDLTLLPFESEDPPFSHTMLSVDRADFGAILRVEERTGKDVPDFFTSFTAKTKKQPDAHYGQTMETPYGQPLKYVLVQDIIGTFNDLAAGDSHRNRAIYDYLSALPSRTKVALYWH